MILSLHLENRELVVGVETLWLVRELQGGLGAGGQLLHDPLHLGRDLLALVHQLGHRRLHAQQLYGGVEHLRVELAAGLQLHHQIHPTLERSELDDLDRLLLVTALDPCQLLSSSLS